jgi:Rrf2 family protein
MRLILNRRTDYGLRAMVALSRDGTRRSARRIGETMAIPATFVGPIMADLTRAGLVHGVPGRAGGYRLARDARSIVVRDVIEALEPSDLPERCSLADRSCDPAVPCALHPIWVAASSAYLETFGSVTLATLAASDAATRQGGLR